jgi:hypothetical protein
MFAITKGVQGSAQLPAPPLEHVGGLRNNLICPSGNSLSCRSATLITR